MGGLRVYCGSIGNFVWAVLGSNASGGMAFTNVCTSSDSGKTWQVGKTNAMCTEDLGGMCTGAGFASAKVGFLCFDPNGSNGSPGIARTSDGGKTWRRLEGTIPAALRKNACFTPHCPLLSGSFGAIPVTGTTHVGSSDKTSTTYLTTADGGNSWQWEKELWQ
jgi:hypothetical protein